jgi:hypothetical protein
MQTLVPDTRRQRERYPHIRNQTMASTTVTTAMPVVNAMAGRIDDIDAGVLPQDRGDLRQDGDAALAFEVVGIERALGDALVVAERARLLEQPVDERGLAAIDVGDDGDVAEIYMRNSRRKPKRAPKGPCVGPEYSDRRAVRNAAPLSLVAEPSMARCSGLLSRGGLRSCLGFAAVLAEQGGAARGDGEADLVERKRKRHLHRLVVVVVLALMDDGDQEIVGIELEPIERLQ